MKLSAIIAPLLEAKADPAVILALVEAYEAEVEEGKEKARQRWRTWKERHPTNVGKRLQTRTNVSKQLAGGDARVEDKTSNLEIEPQKEEKKETRASALSLEFEEFWSAFPNKVGKPKARASFVAARQKAQLAAILAGLQRYIATKPPDRAWLNPTTFLNQERWADQPAAVHPMARAGPAMPSMAELARTFGEAGHGPGQANEDRGSVGTALPRLSLVGSG